MRQIFGIFASAPAPSPARGFSLCEKLRLVRSSCEPLNKFRRGENFLYDSSPVDFINKMNINYSKSLRSTYPTPLAVVFFFLFVFAQSRVVGGWQEVRREFY